MFKTAISGKARGIIDRRMPVLLEYVHILGLVEKSTCGVCVCEVEHLLCSPKVLILTPGSGCQLWEFYRPTHASTGPVFTEHFSGTFFVFFSKIC